MVDGFDFREFVERQQWIFAKTYAKRSPHEYVVRGKINGADDEFAQAVMYIREHGFKVKLFKTVYVCLQLDNRFYWTMGAPVDETTILNRNNLDDYQVVLYVKDKEWQ